MSQNGLSLFPFLSLDSAWYPLAEGTYNYLRVANAQSVLLPILGTITKWWLPSISCSNLKQRDDLSCSFSGGIAVYPSVVLIFWRWATRGRGCSQSDMIASLLIFSFLINLLISRIMDNVLDMFPWQFVMSWILSVGLDYLKTGFKCVT